MFLVQNTGYGIPFLHRRSKIECPLQGIVSERRPLDSDLGRAEIELQAAEWRWRKGPPGRDVIRASSSDQPMKGGRSVVRFGIDGVTLAEPLALVAAQTQPQRTHQFF